ncbi:dihydrodipicolinate synthase family protein [Martelella endophytica]|uniref:N-acetylneuraminate lyase n=1 Tax=Martelella endophytica TaxID=1486262 RepID=A0A0D5LQ56_MAREN|nr:dihydrodipicolinate synthase family protein [Martelella endophytica]AJY45458.1 N-acetylneuraminate lyase [Martelella endophytica]
MKSLSGIYAALLTAMDDTGGFSPERQRALDAYVLRQGQKGLYVAGSSGESGMLESGELAEVMAVVAEDAKGSDATLIAHVGLPSLRASTMLAKEAEKRGYHALSALPPHSYPFSDGEILAYYRELCRATSLPLIVYEIPARTGRPLPTPLLLEILDLPNVAGLKFSSMDLFKFCTLRRARPDKVFYFGYDEAYGAAAALGTDGGIGTTYNLFGRLYVAIDAALLASDIATAQRLQTISQRFVEILVETGVMPGMKVALRLRGIDAGPSRAPMLLKAADAEKRLAAFLAEPDVAEWLA